MILKYSEMSMHQTPIFSEANHRSKLAIASTVAQPIEKPRNDDLIASRLTVLSVFFWIAGERKVNLACARGGARS